MQEYTDVGVNVYYWVQLTKLTQIVIIEFLLWTASGASVAWDFLRELISAHSTYQAISNVRLYLPTALWRAMERQVFVHRSTLSIRGHSCWALNLMVSVGVVGFQADWW